MSRHLWLLGLGVIAIVAACSRGDPATGNGAAAGGAGAGALVAARTQAAGAAGTAGATEAGGGAFAGGARGGGSGGLAGGFGGGRGGFGGAGAGRFATIPVQAAVVSVGPLVTEHTTAGTIEPETQSQVAAQTSGVVARILHKVGDWVAVGETVVLLDDSALKIAYQNARAAAENARINLEVGQQSTAASSPKLQDQLTSAQSALAAAQRSYDSQKATFDLGGISASALDTAKSQLDLAHANLLAAQAALDQNRQADSQNLAQLKLQLEQASNQLQLAELSLRNASVKAPFAGQIAAVNVSPGVFVGQNTSVFLLVSQERQIEFTAPPTDAAGLRVGSPVTFTYGTTRWTVKILRPPSAPIDGVVPLVASPPPGVSLPFGTVGSVSYDMTLATGAQIPVSAIQTRADQDFVYVITDGKAMEQPISILAESGSTAVVEGAEDGAQVIVDPPPGLLAGSTVQVVGAQVAQASAGGRPGIGSGAGAATGRADAASGGGQRGQYSGSGGRAGDTAASGNAGGGGTGQRRAGQSGTGGGFGGRAAGGAAGAATSQGPTTQAATGSPGGAP